MKIELNAETRELLKQILIEFGIADTIANREQLCELSLMTGLLSVMMHRGIFHVISKSVGHDVTAYVAAEEKPTPTPIVCDDCGRKIIHNGLCYVCNCCIWPGPPETIK